MENFKHLINPPVLEGYDVEHIHTFETAYTHYKKVGGPLSPMLCLTTTQSSIVSIFLKFKGNEGTDDVSSMVLTTEPENADKVTMAEVIGALYASIGEGPLLKHLRQMKMEGTDLAAFIQYYEKFERIAKHFKKKIKAKEAMKLFLKGIMPRTYAHPLYDQISLFDMNKEECFKKLFITYQAMEGISVNSERQEKNNKGTEKKEKNQKKDKNSDKTKDTKNNEYALRSKTQCNYCNAIGHKEIDCKKKKDGITTKCSNCGLIGHKTSDCWKPKSISSKAANIGPPEPNIKIEIEGTRLNALVDTGSSATFLPVSSISRMREPKIIPWKTLTINGATDKMVDETTPFALSTMLFGKHVILPIVKGSSSEIIIGRDLIPLLEITQSAKSLNKDDWNTLYPEVFADLTNDGPHENLPHFCIKLQEGAVPVARKPRTFPIAKRQFIKDQISEWIRQGIIERSNSAWASPIMVAPKGDTYRLCIDYKHTVNPITLEDPYPLPRQKDILDALTGYKYFSKVDLKSGYLQIDVTEADREKTAFTTHEGHYQFRKMPFGATNSGKMFQRIIDKICKDLEISNIYVYQDDILIGAVTLEELTQATHKLMAALVTYKLKVNKKKVEFGMTEIEFLGHIISKGTRRPNPKRIQGLQNLRVPRTTTELRSFLGAFNYLRDYIQGFALMAAPLYKKTGGEKRTTLTFTEDELQAIDRMKTSLSEQTLLEFPDRSLPMILQTDASKTAIGGALYQIRDGKRRPIGFTSKVLSDTESRWTTNEQEMLGVVHAVEHFSDILTGIRFTIETDHLNLLYEKAKSQKVMRWKAHLNEFDYQIKHISGETNLVADTLSRATSESEQIINTAAVTVISEIFQDDETEDDLCYYCQCGTMTEVFNCDGICQHAYCTTCLGTTPPIGSEKWLCPTCSQGKIECVTCARYVDEKETQRCKKCHKATCCNQEDPDWECGNHECVSPDCQNHVMTHRCWFCTKPAHVSCLEEQSIELLENTDKFFICKDCMGKTRERPSWFAGTTRSRKIPKISKGTITNEQWEKIINEAHAHPMYGHAGVEITRDRIRSELGENPPNAMLNQIVSNCEICSQAMGKAKPHELQLFQTRGKFQDLHVDFIGPFPSTKNRNRFVFSIVDRATRYVRFLAMPMYTAEATVQMLLKGWIFTFGIPLSIVSDQGSQFTSRLWEDTMKSLNIKHAMSSIAHPQSNGLAEAANKKVKQILKKLVIEKPDEWDDYLPMAAFAINTAKHAAFGTSPYRVTFGTNPRGPISTVSESFEEDRQTLIDEKFNEIWRATRKELNVYETRYKAYFDNRAVNIKFEIGDRVMLITKGPIPRREGPFEVIAVNKFTCDLKIRNDVKSFNQARLVPIPSSELKRQPQFMKVEEIVETTFDDDVAVARVRWEDGSLSELPLCDVEHTSAYKKYDKERDNKQVLKEEDSVGSQGFPTDKMQL